MASPVKPIKPKPNPFIKGRVMSPTVAEQGNGVPGAGVPTRAAQNPFAPAPSALRNFSRRFQRGR